MNLSMPGNLADRYTSGAQRARVVTESWAADNLYCPNCAAPRLTRLENNARANDFSCPACGGWYQLKGQKTRLGDSITDGAYASMMAAIQNDQTPNFYFLHYDLATWHVQNLLLVPSFAFPPSAIIRRPPLAATARRAGWVGCNIALHRIPREARIAIVTNHQAVSAGEVRAQYQRVKPLKDLSLNQRGWTLDVLTLIRRLVETRPPGTAPEFTNADAYTLAPELTALHPDNRHVKDKIRQQLQVLRDLGLLTHLAAGRWTIAP